MDDIARLIDQQLRSLEQVEPADRARMATSMLHKLGIWTRWVSNTRARALLELRGQGSSAIELADMLGVTRQQIHRLLRDAVGEKYVAADDA